jgi:hypothetical protein
MASLLYEQEPQGQVNDNGAQSRDGERWLLSNESFFDAFVLGAETPAIQLTATEQSDTAAFTSTANATVAATEGADTASFAAQSDETPISLAATEQADTASFSVAVGLALAVTEAADVASFISTVNALLSVTEAGDTATFRTDVNASLASTEAADTASMTVMVTAALAVTEDADVAAFAAQEDGSVALAATEDGDTANGGVGPAAVSGGGGGSVVRFSSPGSAYINWHKSKVRKARAKIQEAKDDPLLAQKREFQQALAEAYVALAQLVSLVEANKKAQYERELEELKQQALQLERESQALLEKQRLEAEEEELLAANLW